MNLTELINRMTMARALMFSLLLAGLYYAIRFDSGANLKSQIDSMQTQLTDKQAQLNGMQAKIERAARYKSSKAEYGETLKNLLSMIPEKFDDTDLERIISDEVKVAGSSLVGISGQVDSGRGSRGEAGLEEFQELAVAVEVQGSFAQHMIFLSNLTKVRQILIVKKISLESVLAGNSNEPAQVKMSATIHAYRYVGQTK